MKALAYKAPNLVALESRPQPTIHSPTDAIVKLRYTTICGTDLHRETTPGRILGHEGVGTITDLGSSVPGFKIGDNVILSCVNSCSSCPPCRRGMPSHCKVAGGVLGHIVDGAQAEYLRVPCAAGSMYHLPEDVDAKAAVMLSDVLPTGLECGVLNGRVKPGCSVAIVGAGPVGLAALMTAQLYSPALIVVLDIDSARLSVAEHLGATCAINSNNPEEAVEKVKKLTDGEGCDTVIEAVGIAPTFELCQELVAPGGTIANIGLHAKKVDLHLEKLWNRNVTITTRHIDAVTTPMLLKMVQAGKIDPMALITHEFAFKDIEKAYEVFRDAPQHKAIKVLIRRSAAENRISYFESKHWRWGREYRRLQIRRGSSAAKVVIKGGQNS